MIDIASSYLAAVTSLSTLTQEAKRLETENTQLIAGTARQAKTIRQLNEQLSHKETEVQVEQYNVEFVKQQARKTRVINREKLKALKVKKTDLNNAHLEIATLKKTAENLRHILTQTEAERVRLTHRLAQALMGHRVPTPEVRFVTEREERTRVQQRKGFGFRTPFTQREFRIDMLSMGMVFDDAVVNDIRHAEAVAKQASEAIAAELEAKVVEAIMGKKMTREDRGKPEYELRMKEARQNYGDYPHTFPGLGIGRD